MTGIDAGAGNDELTGDGYWMSATAVGGDDDLTGGEGADLFYFVGRFGKDVVQDFSGAGGEGDTLWIDVPQEQLTITGAGTGIIRIVNGDNEVRLIGNPEFDPATDIRLWDVAPLGAEPADAGLDRAAATAPADLDPLRAGPAADAEFNPAAAPHLWDLDLLV